jgi:hypothetical protein
MVRLWIGTWRREERWGGWDRDLETLGLMGRLVIGTW